MTLRASELLSLIDTINYPADVLAEKDGRVMFRLERNALMDMIEDGYVVGTGSRG